MSYQDKTHKKNRDENSSYFVIDLKKGLQKREEEKEDKNKISNFLEKLVEGEAKLNPQKKLTAVKEKIYFYFSNTASNIKRIKDISFFVFLFSLTRFLWRLFYYFIFKIVWVVLFVVRFFYFLLLFPFKKIINFTPGLIKNIFLVFSWLPVFARNKKNKLDSKKRMSKENVYVKKVEDLAHDIKTNKLKSIMIFLGILMVMVLPLKAFFYYKNLDNTRGKVLGVSETAISSFLGATESISNMDFEQARNNFNFADSNFSQAQKELGEINGLIFALSSVYPNKNIRIASNAQNILTAGELAAELGKNLSEMLDNLVSKEEEITVAIDRLIIGCEKMIVTSKSLEERISKIDADNLPDEYREKFILLKDKSSFLSSGLEEFIEMAKGINVLLGAKYDKRYLLIFQNNAELRATGGFIGSFALIDFREGKIKNIEVPGGGSYDTEGGLRTLVSAPGPLQLVNPLWHFWDANWWPDWPTSAKKLMWFYEKSDGPTVDGVISLTPTVLEKILEITGPINMEEKYGVILDHNNFWQTVQGFAEQKQDVTVEPKKIIGDMAAKLIEELPQRLNKDVLLELVSSISENLNQKQILFYFEDDDLQKKVDDYDWSGRIKNTSRDYLSVINTNIAGGKSDKKIKETIYHESRVMNNGSVVNTVKIERTHTGIKNEQFIGVRNVNWIRVYVPLGSELIEASGFERPDDIYFEDPDSSWQKDEEIERVEKTLKIDPRSGTEIYRENSHTVFANWSMVDPGKTVTIYLKYKLPFKIELKNNESNKLKFWQKSSSNDYYSLLVQKQAGSMPSSFVSNLILSDAMSINWSYPDSLTGNINKNSWNIEDSLDTDKYWAVILKSKD